MNLLKSVLPKIIILIIALLLIKAVSAQVVTSTFSATALSTSAVVPVITTSPDLIITDIKFLQTPREGKIAKYSVDVKNIGNKPVVLSDYSLVTCTLTSGTLRCSSDDVLKFKVDLYRKEPDFFPSRFRWVHVFGTEELMKKSYASKGAINPGETVTFTLPNGIRFDKAGEHRIRVVADSNNILEEIKEDNNRLTKWFTVTRGFVVVENPEPVAVVPVDINRTRILSPPPNGGGSSGNGFTVTDALVGGENQERKNDVTATFIIKNNQNSAVSGIQITANADSKYNVRFTNVPLSIGAGQQATITVTANIPDEFDAVGTDCLKQAFEIGTVTVKGNNVVQGTSKLKMQTKNHIEIRDFDVEVGSRSENVNDGDDVEVMPRELIRLIVELKNTFNDNTHDFSIEGDLEIDAEEDGEEGLDLIDDREDFDVDADDTEEIEFSGEVGRKIEDGKMNVKVKACGEDDNGARHGDIIEFKLNVDKKKEALSIEDASVTPNIVSCDGTATVSFAIFNDGKRDQDEISYVIESTELGVKIEQDELELDEGDDIKLSKKFRVDKAKAKRDGEYELSIKVYADGSLMDEEAVKFNAKDCEEVKEKEETTPTKVQPQEQPKTEEPAAQAKNKSFRDSPWYVVLLITAIILLGGTAGYFGWLAYKQEW